MDKSTPLVRCKKEFAILVAFGIDTSASSRHNLSEFITYSLGNITEAGLYLISMNALGALVIA